MERRFRGKPSFFVLSCNGIEMGICGFNAQRGV